MIFPLWLPGTLLCRVGSRIQEVYCAGHWNRLVPAPIQQVLFTIFSTLLLGSLLVGCSATTKDYRTTGSSIAVTTGTSGYGTYIGTGSYYYSLYYRPYYRYRYGSYYYQSYRPYYRPGIYKYRGYRPYYSPGYYRPYYRPGTYELKYQPGYHRTYRDMRPYYNPGYRGPNYRRHR